MKKKLAFLLITAMTVSMISACGTDKEKTEEGQTVESTTEAEGSTQTEDVETVLLKKPLNTSILKGNQTKKVTSGTM